MLKVMNQMFSLLVTWEPDASNSLYPAIWFGADTNTALPVEQKFPKFPIYASICKKEKKILFLNKNIRRNR